RVEVLLGLTLPLTLGVQKSKLFEACPEEEWVGTSLVVGNPLDLMRPKRSEPFFTSDKPPCNLPPLFLAERVYAQLVPLPPPDFLEDRSVECGEEDMEVR